jgi:hypothetical protein
MSSSSSHSCSCPSRSCSCPSPSYTCPSGSSTSRARWLTWHACMVRSSSCLMTVPARASADAYNSYVSARARLKLASH